MSPGSVLPIAAVPIPASPNLWEPSQVTYLHNCFLWSTPALTLPHLRKKKWRAVTPIPCSCPAPALRGPCRARADLQSLLYRQPSPSEPHGLSNLCLHTLPHTWLQPFPNWPFLLHTPGKSLPDQFSPPAMLWPHPADLKEPCPSVFPDPFPIQK